MWWDIKEHWRLIQPSDARVDSCFKCIKQHSPFFFAMHWIYRGSNSMIRIFHSQMPASTTVKLDGIYKTMEQRAILCKQSDTHLTSNGAHRAFSHCRLCIEFMDDNWLSEVLTFYRKKNNSNDINSSKDKELSSLCIELLFLVLRLACCLRCTSWNPATRNQKVENFQGSTGFQTEHVLSILPWKIATISLSLS